MINLEKIFSQKEILPDLPGIILLSHGSMAMGVLESAQMIMGPISNIVVLSFETGDELEKYHNSLKEILVHFPAGIIAMVDLFCGTPCNQLQLIALQSDQAIFALSGLNLPMLLDAISLRSSYSGRQLFDLVASNACESIINITAKIEEVQSSCLLD